MGVKAIYFNSLDIGKHVKKSKKRFVWRFSIDGKEHTIELVISFLSGKKKITHDGRLLYEGQKVLTNSFQFPFEVDMNMCNIIQSGESFDLRINNMAFSQLSGSGGSRSAHDEYGSKGYKSTSQSQSSYGGQSSKYGGQSSYGGQGSGSRNDFGGHSSSRGGDYGGQGSGSYGGSGSGSGHRVNMDSSSYKKPNESTASRSRGWDDVKNAEREARKDQHSTKQKEEPNVFDHGFDKYEYKGETQKKASAPSGNRGGFDDFGTTSQTTTKKPDFADFSTFDNFGSQSAPKKQEDFSGFGNFGGFDSQAPQHKKPVELPKPQQNNNLDILGLDFSNNQSQSQGSQGTQNKQAGGFDDFFGAPAQPTTTQNQGFGQPAPQSNANTGGGLLDLDFGGGSQPQAQAPSNNQGGFDLMGGQPQAQPQAQTTSNNNQGGFDFLGGDQPQTTQQGNQAQPQKTQPAKSSLWDSDLVSLDSNELTNPQQQFGNQNQNNFGGFGGNQGMGGYGNMSMGMGMGMNTNASGFGGNSGFGNQGAFGGNQGMGGMNTNSGFGGMGMSNNAGGFGGNQAGFGGNQTGFGGNQAGFGGNQGGFGGSQSMNTNAGGFGGNQGGFGGNQSMNTNAGGFGGNQGGFGGNQGMSNNAGGFGGYNQNQNQSNQNDFGMGGGFQQQQQFPPQQDQAAAGGDIVTPFDF